MKKILFLVLLSTIFVFASCGGGTSSTPTKCTNNSECESNETCNTDTGKCEATFGCTNNRQCDAGETCNLATKTCEKVFICSSAQSCYDHDSTWNADSNPAMCVAGECRADGCKSNQDCKGGKLCNVASGKCEEAASCDNVGEVKIVTPSFVLTEGNTKELKAIVLNSNGAPINTSGSFTWASSKTDIVAVDVNGVVTGGASDGSSDITVSICNKTSQALNIQNFATVENGKLRVIVRDVDGKKVTGATVKAKDESMVTDNEGVALFDNTETKNNITVTMAGFQSLTFLDVEGKDIIAYLIKAVDNTKSGGFKGMFDFDHPTIKKNGLTRLGFAGASLPGNILDLDFGLLLGEPIMRHIDTAGIQEDIALPSGLVLFLGDDDVISGSYAATGLEGDRTLWGWGGRGSLSQVLGIVQEAMDAGMENLDMGKLLSQLMPIAEKFNHSIKANQNITHCPKIADVNDINGNQDTTDKISDFDSSCFPTVNMTLNQPLSQMSTFKFPALPTIEGERAEVELLLVSTIVEGKGMVPLGLGAGVDKKDNNDTADGKIDDTHIVYAPQHDGIANNDSMVVSMSMIINKDAMNPQGNTKVNDMMVKLTGLVKFYKDGVIEDNIDMSNDTYLKLAEDAKLANNEVTFTAIDGATLYRLSVVDADGNVWVVYSPNTTISIADKPIGNINTIIVQAVTLSKDNTEVSYNDLLKFNNSNLDDLVRLIKKFSAYQIDLSAK